MPPETAVALDASAAEDLEFRAITWPERARAVAVLNAETFQLAGELLTGIKTLRKEIDDTTRPVIDAAHRAHKAACDQKRKLEAPLIEAETILKTAMAAYQREEEARRRKEEARLRELARKAEEEARLAEAERLEAEGEKELAAQVLDLPPVVAAPVLPPPPKVDGIATRKLWRAEVLDLRALCRGVADGTVPANLVQPNQAALNQMAVALKETFALPGCRAVVETTIAAGRR